MSEMNGLDEVSRKQFGLVSRAQARAAGFSEDAIRWRLECKEWEAFRPLVYRFRGTSVTWSQLAMGALLSAGPGSALSHRTAAFLFKLDGLKRDRPRVIDVSTNRHKSIARPGILHHRLREETLPTTITQGLTTSTLARTLVDLAGVLTARSLEIALDSARRDNPLLPDELADYAKTISRRRHGLDLLLKLLASRASPRDSAFEVDVFNELDRLGLPKPIAGYSIFDEQHRYVMKADAAWVAQKVALHMDSYHYHHHRERFERDARQRNALALLKWTNVVVTPRSLADPGWSDTLKRLLLISPSCHP